MKKLYALLALSIVFTACKDPLQKVYEPTTYRTDFRAIRDKDTTIANKIQYLILRKEPEIGQTYQDILNEYDVRISEYEESRKKDSIQRAEEEAYRIELITKAEKLIAEEEAKAKNRQERYRKRKVQERKRFIAVLDEWEVKEPYREIAIEEYNEVSGYIKVNPKVKIISNSKIGIDVGSKTIYTYID